MQPLETLAAEVQQLIIDEWTKQGHHLTGAFEKAMYYEIEQGESITIKFYDGTERGYGAILNRGVPAERIPFYPGSGRKYSKYIAGLARYAKLRMGASDKDALSIAFAIAYKHKAEGMPTRDSSRYSSTGKRTEFVQDSTKDIDQVVEKYMKQIIVEKLWQ